MIRCAGCVAAASSWFTPPILGATPAKSKTLRIRIVYALHAPQQAVPDWPNKGFDFQPVMNRIESELRRRCRGFEFLSSTATGAEQAKQIVEQDRAVSIDGYLVYQMNCWNQVVQTVAATGKPTLYADFQFAGSGGFLVYNAAFLRQHAPNVGFVASSRMDDLVRAVKCFEKLKNGGGIADFVAATADVRRSATPRPGRAQWKKDDLQPLPTRDLVQQLKESRILAFRGQESGPAGSIFGIPIQHVPFRELNDAWKAADQDEARELAQRWTTSASRVEGVSRKTLEESAAMYLAQKAILKKYGAQAITINCLGGFYGGHIHAYPCLGFHELLNEGIVGACECDVRSTAAMVAVTALTRGRPGYISDPVLDSSKRQIIYAHCVASNRPLGPQSAPVPFQILTHSEDRQGASVRSILPVGHITTTLEVTEETKEILLHQAKSVDNDPDDRACRTKLCAEPLGDFEKLFTQWDRWGWHRVTCYGDLKEPIAALAEALGYRIVVET